MAINTKYITHLAEPDKFLTEVKKISSQLGIQPDWLLAVMYNESRIKPTAVNTKSGATGLIQFMPATAKALGTTTANIRTLNETDQLRFVYDYFLPYKGRMRSIYDVYKVVFFPVALGKLSDWTFHTTSLTEKLVATQNPIFDLNKDGKITVAEFETFVKTKMIPADFLLKETQTGFIATILLLICGYGLFTFK